MLEKELTNTERETMLVHRFSFIARGCDAHRLDLKDVDLIVEINLGASIQNNIKAETMRILFGICLPAVVLDMGCGRMYSMSTSPTY